MAALVNQEWSRPVQCPATFLCVDELRDKLRLAVDTRAAQLAKLEESYCKAMRYAVANANKTQVGLSHPVFWALPNPLNKVLGTSATSFPSQFFSNQHQPLIYPMTSSFTQQPS